jgi:glycosyltransferase involved in cell wall biosynthesis
VKRARVAFLAWGSTPGRSTEIAEALEGESRCYYDLRIVARPLVPVRYLISALRTVGYLLSRRPRALVVTNPPIFVSLVAYPYALLTRVPLLLDSHPDAFRADGPHARFRGLHAWLARRARAVLVTTDDLVRQVEEWGGRGIVVHEPPPTWEIDEPASLAQPRILVLGTLSADEPVEAAVDAARLLPDLRFEFTGDVRKRTLASVPDNVSFLGFLRGDDYVAALERASVTVVLTTWLGWAVPRSAYDAVYALRPLVASDSAVLRPLFPAAIFVQNDPGALAEGIRESIRRHDELVAAAPAARETQTERWRTQLELLRALITPRAR